MDKDEQELAGFVMYGSLFMLVLMALAWILSVWGWAGVLIASYGWIYVCETVRRL